MTTTTHAPPRTASRLAFLCGLFGASLAGLAAGQEPSGADAATGALEAWRRLGAPVWRFDSTGIEAGPEDATAYLVSVEEFKDFRVEVDYWVADETNSGIFVRCGAVRDLDDVNPDNCYEVNIWDNHPNQDYRTGSIVKRALPIRRADSLGHWNRLEIAASGSHMTVYVNGEVLSQLDDAAAVTGPIALQYAGNGLLRFRNFKIRAE